MTRPSEGEVVIVKSTTSTAELGIVGLYGIVERPERAAAWVLVGGVRYRLFYDEMQSAS